MPSIRHVILPDSGAGLLREELDLAFSDLGLKVSRVKPELLRMKGLPKLELEELLGNGPSLVLSINFEGLSTLKPLMEKMALHRGAVAAWFVDNPWNILSGVRDPRWKQLPLFVTDAAFIPGLKREGAERVFHLPLAASPEFFSARAKQNGKPATVRELSPFVFVGRSVFPGKKKFFEGITVPDILQKEAETLLNQGLRPDFLWWEKRLYSNGLPPLSEASGKHPVHVEGQSPEEAAQARIRAHREKRKNAPGGDVQKKTGSTTEITPPYNKNNNSASGYAAPPVPVRFWPGKEARRPALGAEESALLWRTACLREAATAGVALLQKGTHSGLDIFGDEGWQNLLPDSVRLHLPVDYYTRLPAIYAAARFSLCLTSLQLPSGLTQRNFDVWMAGGLGLTDATPGLDIFPEELTRYVRFSRPNDILAAAQRAEGYPGGRAKLIADWQNCLLEKHCYIHRAEELLRHI